MVKEYKKDKTMKINDACDYLIHLIACAIQNETPEPLPYGIEYEQVLSCAVGHDVAGFAYLGVMRAETKPDADTLNKWKQRYLLGINRHSEQEETRKKLLSALHEKGIATLEIQGTRVKEYYPSPDLRMMSDIDVIIEKEYIPEAEKILKNLGYKTSGKGGFEVSGHRKGIHIEIHTDFFLKSHKYAGILSDPFGLATVNRDYTATVPDTVFWAYHLLHCLKHYYSKGIGLRRVLDLYFLAPEMAKTADAGYIDKLLKENGLYEDVKDIFAVSKYWFDSIEPDRDIEDKIGIIKNAGTHGNMKLYYNNKFAGMRKEGKHFVKLRCFLSLVFPSKNSIYNAYPVCEKHHFPYPMAWLCRTIRILFKPGRLMRHIRDFRNAKAKTL